MRFVDGRIHVWVRILAVGIGGAGQSHQNEDIISESQLPAADIAKRAVAVAPASGVEPGFHQGTRWTFASELSCNRCGQYREASRS